MFFKSVLHNESINIILAIVHLYFQLCSEAGPVLLNYSPVTIFPNVVETVELLNRPEQPVSFP